MSRILSIVLLASIASGSFGCQTPDPSSPKASGVIQCVKEEVYTASVQVIPQVNEALRQADWRAALKAIVAKAPGVTWDVLACAIRSAAHSYKAASSANPDDTISKESAERAATFLQEEGYVFGS